MSSKQQQFPLESAILNMIIAAVLKSAILSIAAVAAVLRNFFYNIACV